MSNEYQEWNALVEYQVGDRFIRDGRLCEITQTGPSAEKVESEIKHLANGNVLIGNVEYYPVPDKTFESELHDLITKYNLNHTKLTPEFIKQQIMRDNITTHNESLRDEPYITVKITEEELFNSVMASSGVDPLRISGAR